MNLANQTDSFAAQDLAGKAILFEIGAKSGILELIEREQEFKPTDLSKQLDIQQDFLTIYLETLTNLELLAKRKVENTHEEIYTKTASYQQEKNKIGYIAWGMISCAPLISNTQAFTADFATAVRLYHRSGEHVARTSNWMGAKDFYPHAENVITQLQPKKMVDLGSGTCGLLIRLAQKIPGLIGIGVDLSQDACDKAQVHLKECALEDRIKVIVSPIQNLIQNKDVFLNADVIHAGFVFHDLLPDEEKKLDSLLICINQTAPNTTLVIVDAIPFSKNQHERAFSSAFSFLHQFYMGRQLLSESAWQIKLKNAGFNHVAIESLGISGGRIFVAKKS